MSQSQYQVDKTFEDELEVVTLPPYIITNIHPKVEAAHLPVNVIKLKEKHDRHKLLVFYNANPPPEPMSSHPLTICCTPKYLNLQLSEEPIVAKVGVINCCTRPIYVQCCGLWGEDTARLGASWCVYPRKRYWLSPGMRMDVYVKVTPRQVQMVQSAVTVLQLDATHLRDNVTGYFRVPIKATFLKYSPPPLMENE